MERVAPTWKCSITSRSAKYRHSSAASKRGATADCIPAGRGILQRLQVVRLMRWAADLVGEGIRDQ
eukprot:4026385-Pyramimonas_sp.AAC.1